MSPYDYKNPYLASWYGLAGIYGLLPQSMKDRAKLKRQVRFCFAGIQDYEEIPDRRTSTVDLLI